MEKTIYQAGNQSPEDPFEFILSTDSVNRYGDVVEQDWNLGPFLLNPIALFGHDHSEPIGVWEKVRMQGGKLLARLSFAQHGTSAFIDMLRSLVEQRILRAVSVGFISRKARPIDEDDPYSGFRLSENELLECSLVSVGANAEALAVTNSLDPDMRARLFATHSEQRSARAQLGFTSQDSDQPSNKSQTRSTAKMSLSQKIEAKTGQLNKFKDQLTELDASYDAEEDMPKEVATQYTELTAQVDRCAGELATLQNAEKAMMQRAAVQNPDAPSTVTVQRITAKKERKPGFNAMAAIASMVMAHEQKVSPVFVAEHSYKDDPEIKAIVQAASAPADMTTDGWASQLVRDTWSEFLYLLRDMSIYPSLPGMRLEFDRSGKIIVPRGQGRGELAGGWVDEGAPIPVKQGLMDQTDLTPKTMAVISTFTNKLGRHSVPAIQQLIENRILGDTAERLDANYLDDVARSTGRPAGMQDATETGAGNINVSTGATVAAIIADLKGMISRMLAARAGNTGVWIMSPINVLNLITIQDAASGEFPFAAQVEAGTLFKYPILSSQNVPDDLVVMQGNEAVNYGNDYAPQIEVSDQATLVFDDTAPEDIVSGGLATTQPVKSMFQTLSTAIRMDMGLDWRIVRQGGVQGLTSVSWS